MVYILLIINIITHFKNLIEAYNKTPLKSKIFKWLIKNVWFVKNLYLKEIKKLEDTINKDLNKHVEKKCVQLYETGMTMEKIKDRLKKWAERDERLTTTGKVSGCRYADID